MRRPLLLAAAALAALTCAYTWPLSLHAGSQVAHDRGDPLLVTWILWWSTHTLPLTHAWWNAPAFYPSSGVFAFSENLLGLAPIAWPIIALTGQPLLAYNVAFLLSFVLSGAGAYFLGYVLTRRHDAAFIAAVAFAFAPYRLSHMQHLQLLSAYWMPVAIASLHLYFRSAKARWAVLFAASWLMQALACGYYFFYLTLFAGLWLVCLAPRQLTRRSAAVLGAAWLAAGLVLAPVLLGYRTIQTEYGFKRSPVEIVNYSADVAGIWSAAPDSLVWHGLHGTAVSSESEQFPGLTPVILLVVGLAFAIRRREGRGLLGFYAGAAALIWILSLGPEPRLHGISLGVIGPYRLLAALPGFNGMRVPARLWMVSVLCLSVCAALACNAFGSPRARKWTMAIVTLGLLLDGWPRALPLFAAPPMRTTASRARARLGLPVRETETETMYGAIAQDRPVFNGYSGYVAPQHAALIDLLEQHDPRILARLAATDAIEVVIEDANDPGREWNAYVASQSGATPIESGQGWTAYEIAPTGYAAAAPLSGASIPIAAIHASTNEKDIGAVLDGDIESRWHAARQHGGETITLDLASSQRVRGLTMSLGAYPGQYPRALTVEVSADGIAWQTVRSGGTALATYDAAIVSPRDVPVDVSIDRDGVRFIRLRQTGSDAHGWSIVELRVWR